jgi:hypothetical protein
MARALEAADGLLLDALEAMWLLSVSRGNPNRVPTTPANEPAKSVEVSKVDIATV